MAFAQIKGFKPKEKLKDYKVFKKSEAPKEKIITKEIIKEIPVEKIIEKEGEKLPRNLKGIFEQALKHARRAGQEVPDDITRFFEK